MRKWKVVVQDYKTEEVVYTKEHLSYDAAKEDYDEQAEVESLDFEYSLLQLIE